MIRVYYKDHEKNTQSFTADNKDQALSLVKSIIEAGHVMNDVEYVDYERKCRVCGCDQEHACKGGCYWVYDDLCSQCYEKMMSFSIKKRKVQLIGDVIQDGFYDLETIAEDIQTQEMAEGFIYGYTAAKDYIDLSDDSVDSDSEFEAIGISIWQDDEPITEFFFTEVQSC